MINVMDIKIAVTTTARPEKTVETADLPEQFARCARPFFRELRRQWPGCHAVTAHENDVADFAVLNSFVNFLERFAVPRHQTDADFQSLRHRLFAKRQHSF